MSEQESRHGAACGCPEYEALSRRQFMYASSGVALAAMSAPAWLPRAVFAREYRSSQRDVIIQVYQRGASDGLTICVPYADNNYYTLRPTLNIPRPDDPVAPEKCTDLDGFFGVPPGMTALLPAYQNGHLLFVHACGSTDPSRSHFDAQRFMEVGKPNDPLLGTGWLGRHLATVTPMDPLAALRGVGIASGLARSLVGGPKTLPIPNLGGFGLTGFNTTKPQRRSAISDMYNAAGDPLAAQAATTMQTIDTLAAINFAGYVPGGGAVYGTYSLATALKSAAALIKANVGVEAIAIDVGNWDTHSNQGNLAAGVMANNMTQLAGAMNAFYTDMMSSGTNPTWTMVVLSEFGRRPAENGSFGTDHGHGNAMMVMGNMVAGGRVLRTWPGLGPGQLYQNLDLQVTIDYRDILWEIIHERAGSPSAATIFPNYVPVDRGVFV